jgi:hypothetical protein
MFHLSTLLFYLLLVLYDFSLAERGYKTGYKSCLEWNDLNFFIEKLTVNAETAPARWPGL